MSALDVGGARSRLAARESFFGGPISTREQAKAPGWQAFVNKPVPEKEVGKSKGGSKGAKPGGGAGAKPRQPIPPPPDPEQERRQKIKQRRDYSGLDEDAPPPPPPSRQQQTAAGPPPRQQQQQRLNAAAMGSNHKQQQQQSRQKVTTKRAATGGGGRMAVAARNMAMEVTAVGKGRKQMASAALKQRVGEMVAGHAAAVGGRPAGAAGLGSPTGSGTAGGSGGAAAAAAAARAARDAAGAKAVMETKQYRTAHGMQTLQLVSRLPAHGGRGAAAGAAGGAALAAMHAGAAGPGAGRGAGASPGSVSKGPRPVTGAGAPRRLQQQQQRAAGLAAGRGKPQFRGAFYGGRQPPAALEARMQYNKRRLSLDSGGDLDSFIASDEEGEEWESDGAHDGEEGDWRAALREVTGGYDPTKFAHIDRLPDRDMEVAYDQIQVEERRALRIARTEDEREAEREALREAAKRERKRAKKSGVAAFLDDGD